MSVSNKRMFLGRWIHVPDKVNDGAFFKFVQMSGLTTATVGTGLHIEFTEEDGLWTQHDNFVGVNKVTYAFRPGVENVVAMEDGITLRTTVTISDTTWNWDTQKGSDSYKTEYDFQSDGQSMTIKSVYTGQDGSSFSALAVVKRQTDG